MIKEKVTKLKGKWKNMSAEEKFNCIFPAICYATGIGVGALCYKTVSVKKIDAVAHKAFCVGANAADCTYAHLGGRPDCVLVKKVITNKTGDVVAAKIDIPEVGKKFLTFGYNSLGGVDVLINDSQ